MAEEFDSSDSKAVEKRKKDAKQASLERNETIRKIMSDENARGWIFDILLLCGLGRNPFNKDALLMAHSCGEMNIGLQIHSAVETAAPDLYLKMMKENENG